MCVRSAVILAVAAVGLGCAHKSLSSSDLDRVARPAFVSRIEEEAGPRSTVFRDDGSYSKKLGRLDSKEADRRLQVKLAKVPTDPKDDPAKVRGMTRFELAEALRAEVVSRLPNDAPWSNAVDPAAVGTALESYLVQEVPANAPDYELLRPLGVDAVVEIVIEDYGMRSSGGHAGCFLVGYGRMFLIDGGEIWRRSFRADGISSGMPHIDPFWVGREPARFRAAMGPLVHAVAERFAADLNPPERRPKVLEGVRGDEASRPARKRRDAPERETPDGELPSPD